MTGIMSDEHTASPRGTPVTNPTRGGDRFTNTLQPGEYSKGQLADRVGMPYETLKRWLRDGVYEPHESGRDEQRGKITFHVFTEDDVKALRKLCRQRGVRHRSRALPAPTTQPTPPAA